MTKQLDLIIACSEAGINVMDRQVQLGIHDFVAKIGAHAVAEFLEKFADELDQVRWTKVKEELDPLDFNTKTDYGVSLAAQYTREKAEKLNEELEGPFSTPFHKNVNELPGCDRDCMKDNSPYEDCSAHGRSPRELWDAIEQLQNRPSHKSKLTQELVEQVIEDEIDLALSSRLSLAKAIIKLDK